MAAAGDKIALVDTRAGESAQFFEYAPNSEDIINKIAFSPCNQLLLAAGAQGLRVFDIRNTKMPVYVTKSKLDLTTICFNTRSKTSFIAGDIAGGISFYDFRFTNQ